MSKFEETLKSKYGIALDNHSGEDGADAQLSHGDSNQDPEVEAYVRAREDVDFD